MTTTTSIGMEEKRTELLLDRLLVRSARLFLIASTNEADPVVKSKLFIKVANSEREKEVRGMNEKQQQQQQQ